MEQRKISNNTETRNLAEIAAPTGNVYESTMIIAKRANQIAAEVKPDCSIHQTGTQPQIGGVLKLCRYSGGDF